MLEKILPYEENLFFLINHTHSYFLDCAIWLYSGYKVWIPLYLFLVFVLIYKKNWQEWLPVIIAFLLLFTICDQFSSHLIKPWVARYRPTHYPGIMEHVRTLYDYTGGNYGFISGHATNSFGFATLSALLFRKRYYTIIIFIWAAIMAYSRIYLGVHFISDIVAGGVSGIIIGYIVFRFYIELANKIKIKASSNSLSNYSNYRIKVISVTLVCYTTAFVLLGEELIKFLK